MESQVTQRPLASPWIRVATIHKEESDVDERSRPFGPRLSSDTINNQIAIPAEEPPVTDVWGNFHGGHVFADRIRKEYNISPDEQIYVLNVDFNPGWHVKGRMVNIIEGYANSRRIDGVGESVGVVYSSEGPEGDVAGLPRPLATAPRLQMEALLEDTVDWDEAFRDVSHLEADIRDDYRVDVFPDGPNVLKVRTDLTEFTHELPMEVEEIVNDHLDTTVSTLSVEQPTDD